MRQPEIKTVEAGSALDALEWIENNRHHRADHEEDGGRVVALVLYGHAEAMRISRDVWATLGPMVTPGHPLDTRMYRATNSGRDYMRANGKEPSYPLPSQYPWTRSARA